jgi:hypothetical protein
MTCHLCENVALRIVGKKGFCKQHRAEADAAVIEESRRSQSRRAVNDALRWGGPTITEKEFNESHP